MSEQKYFLGLDVGTNSVGWAVTDQNYNLVKKSGKHLWGARLFGEASTTAERRTNRKNRRRLQRRRWRMVMLQDLFNEEMNKVDPYFFTRLNNSSLRNEDKPESAKVSYLLFNSEGYTDREFFKNYPTIYHLRKAMLENDRQFDLREIYLALAHMIKYRGNFLLEGDLSTSNESKSLIANFDNLNNYILSLSENEDEALPTFDLKTIEYEAIASIFKSTTRKKELSEKLCEQLKIKHSNSDLRSLIIDMISGSVVSANKLFPLLAEENEDIKGIRIDFDSEIFENETLPTLPEKLGDSPANIIFIAKEIYNFRVLTNLLQGSQYISDAMVNLYEAHKTQLAKLKKLMKTYRPNEYNAFFRKLTVKDFNNAKETINNYAAYIGYNKVKKHSVSTCHATSNEDLIKVVKSLLPFDKINDASFEWKKSSDKDDLAFLLKAMEENKFLPRQNSRNNGVLPHQLNEIEMRVILEKQGKYYPFLLEKAKSYANLNEEDYKIVSILKFKIPYYVGPLSRRTDENKPKIQWATFKSEDKITPWNFHDVVDEQASAESFIERMKNSCTYLIGEPTLPKNSLLYTEFVLLNEINNWVINGTPITKEDKDYLIDNLYLKRKKVNITSIEQVLKQKYNGAVIHITTKAGKDLKADDIHANMTSFIDMMNERAFGPALLTDKKSFEKAEEAINIITIIEDKKLAQKKLSELGLTKAQFKYIKTLNYSGWGKLSKKVLDSIKSEIKDENDEVMDYSIMDLMRRTNLNFMEILESKNRFDYREQIDKLNDISELTPYELIDQEYASPAMKRAIRQTFRVVDELKGILNIDGFDSYFVETTREDQKEKKRTISRKKQLEDYYKAAKQFVDEDLKNQLSNQSDESLRRKKMYLYFLQLGKSPYSGKPIDIDRLDKDYDIDHIIPQAKIKDDSLSNIVLVERSLNNKKQDNYPIPSDCITPEGKEWVKTLNSIKISGDIKLFSDEKTKKILRTPNNPLTDDELVGFVNRQLTLANQSIKAITDILKVTDKNAKVIYSKASLVSEFRKAFGFSKCREINDFHHANDAYLNIVVGNTYQKVFTSNFDIKTLQSRREHFEQTKIDPKNFFKRDQFIFGTPALVWKANKYLRDENGDEHETEVKDSSMSIVRKMMSYNDPLVTQMLYTQPGFMNKVSIVSPYNTTKSSSIPLKSDLDMSKYGGYSDLTTPYFLLVRSEGKKNSHIYSLESIPAIFLASMKKEEKLKYLVDNYNLKNPEIIHDRVLIRSVLKVPGPDNSYSLLGISGRSGNAIIVINLSELKLPYYYYNYVSLLSHFLNDENGKEKSNLNIYENKESEVIKLKGQIISKEKNIELFTYLTNNIFERPTYLRLPIVSSSFKALKSKLEEFKSSSLLNQIKIILRCIRLLSCKADRVDLSIIGLSSVIGVKSINKRLIPGTQLISKSITGFYEKTVFTVPED
jgi:CRISPR-associated endonuclease Csn1